MGQFMQNLTQVLCIVIFTLILYNYLTPIHITDLQVLQYGQFQTESLHSWPPADVQRKLPHSPPPDLVMRSRSDSSPCYPPDISDIQISGSYLTEPGCGISH